MTVSTTTSGVTRTGDGVTLEFSFSFEARLAAEIFVSEIVGLVLVAVDPADYVVAIEPNGVGGTVTFTVAPDDGANLYIFRETAQTQLVSVSNQTRYNPEVVEGVWDKHAFLIQELRELANRSVKTIPGGDPDALIETLETSAASAEADAAAAAADAAAAAASAAAAALFDPGNLAGLIALTLSANKLAYPTGTNTWALTDFTAFARTLLDDANAGAMQATLGLTIGTNVQAFNSKLTELAAPTYVRGDIIRRGASGLERLALGTQGKVLLSDGTDIGYGGSVRVPLATKTASASATLDFTEFNNAVYNWYEFELENVKPATDGVYLRARVSSNGGATYDAGASNYQYMGYACGSGGLQNHQSTGAIAIALTYVSAVNIGNAAAELGVTGIVKVYNASLSAGYTRLFATLEYDDTATTVVNMGLSGSRRAAQDTDAVQFLMSSGNITSGTIRMYGLVA